MTFSRLSGTTANRRGKQWAILSALAVLAGSVWLLEATQHMLRVGEKAPQFSAPRAGGGKVALSDYLGRKNVVLFFYPGDFTPGCTREVCAYRDSSAEMERLDAVLLGVSADDDASHARFSSQFHLPYELLADTDRSIARAYHALWLGGIVPLPRRITYVIDREGVIRLAVHHEFGIQAHVADALNALRKLESAKDSRG